MRGTLLVNGTVVDPSGPTVEQKDLILADDRVGNWDADIATTSTVDCSGCLIVPGFVVAHTHLYSGLAAGMPSAGPPPTTFREILERVWWRLDKALDEPSLRASVRVAGMAAVRAGATCLIDHHESPSFIPGSLDLIADELDAIGIRACLTYGATDRHGAEGAAAGLAESARFATAHADDALFRGAIGLHAPFTCSDETLEKAASAGGWKHFHAAEGPDDQVAAKERWNERLFHHLEAIGLLDEKTIVAHAVDLDPSEEEILRSKRTWVTHQARSNMNNGVGYAGRSKNLERVALGTDGIDNDLLGELAGAFFRGRESTGPAVWPDAVDMVAQGHRLAGEIFGEPTFGTLGEGAPGDVVVLDYRPGTPLDENSLAAHLLFGLSSRHVRDVFVAGRSVLRNRKLVRVDESQLLADAAEQAKALWARMDA